MLNQLIEKYFQPISIYKREKCREIIRTVKLSDALSLTKLFETFWNSNEFQTEINENPTILSRLIEMSFVFSLIWSIGTSVDDEGRKQLDLIFREIEGLCLSCSNRFWRRFFFSSGTFPNKDTVFEFYVDLSNRAWLHWEEKLKGEYRWNSRLNIFFYVPYWIWFDEFVFLIQDSVPSGQSSDHRHCSLWIIDPSTVGEKSSSFVCRTGWNRKNDHRTKCSSTTQ